MVCAEFRFYEELNDFLPLSLRKRSFSRRFPGRREPTVKEAIEALGVPHTKVDLVLVNGRSVDFSHRLEEGDRISVYPVFESFDISGVSRVRDRPLRVPRFMLDVDLGRLARWLRLLGFDVSHRGDLREGEIARVAEAEQRIVITHNIGLLEHNAVSRGYCVHSLDPREQLREVMERFQLAARHRP